MTWRLHIVPALEDNQDLEIIVDPECGMLRDAVDYISASIRSPTLAIGRLPTWGSQICQQTYDDISVCPSEVLLQELSGTEEVS